MREVSRRAKLSHSKKKRLKGTQCARFNLFHPLMDLWSLSASLWSRWDPELMLHITENLRSIGFWKKIWKSRLTDVFNGYGNDTITSVQTECSLIVWLTDSGKVWWCVCLMGRFLQTVKSWRLLRKRCRHAGAPVHHGYANLHHTAYLNRPIKVIVFVSNKSVHY